MTYGMWVEYSVMKKCNQRLGQWFCNNYIKGQWPELFYCTDTSEAEAMIQEWLEDHQYINQEPPKVR